MSDSDSDDDAFPNAGQLFRSAFALPDPAPELLNLIKTHPTYPAVTNLLSYYTCVAEENPSRADALTSALVAVRDSPDAPTFGELDLDQIFIDNLADYHCQRLDLDDDNRIFGPTNTFLIASLLSGLSFKYTLTACSDQYGNIMVGLDAEDDSPASEVIVSSACIQLLIAGSKIMPFATSYMKSAEEVATKLGVQKAAGTVKDPNALKLLELTIEHAETGFKAENDIDNVWAILFPT